MVVTDEEFAALRQLVQQQGKTISQLEKWRDQATSVIEDHQKENNIKNRRIVQLELWRESITHIVNELILETGLEVEEIPDKADSGAERSNILSAD